MLYKNARNVRFVLFTKTSSEAVKQLKGTFTAPNTANFQVPMNNM